MQIEAEALAYWYFRLNGFLTTVNFLVHPETRKDSSTEIDVLGVRFPYRSENFRRPMQDDRYFLHSNNRPYIVIAEVTTGTCKLNGPWVSSTARNMDKVIKAVGVVPEEEVSEVASHLRSDGFFSSETTFLTLFCLGASYSDYIASRFSSVQQITWVPVLNFIFRRFKAYRREKAQHSQWDINGHKLWNCAEACKNIEDFVDQVEIVP